MQITIKINPAEKPTETFLCSMVEVYMDKNTDFLYFLTMAQEEPKYIAVSLQTGNRWNNPSLTKEEAVEGLEFVGFVDRVRTSR